MSRASGNNAKKIKIWFEDFWHPSRPKDIESQNLLYQFLSKHYKFELTKNNPDYIIFSCFRRVHLKYTCVKIFYTGENRRPNFHECDFAFTFDHLNTDRHYRLPLYRLYESYDYLLNPREPEKVASEQRKFCCFLVSNPNCKERIEFFHLLNSYKKVDSGGMVLMNIDDPVPPGAELEWIKKYKFCIAFENTSYPGYTTEKLTNALAVNTIPIYWGNPVVEKDFNTRAFINAHDFPNFDAVLEEVKKVDNDPVRYKNILTEPIFPGNTEPEFLKEEQIIKQFEKIFTSKKHFVSRRLKYQNRFQYQLKSTSIIIRRIINKVYRIFFKPS